MSRSNFATDILNFRKPTTAIATEKLSVDFGGKRALENVTVDVPQGRITAIVGPSGCGKSTFLNCLNRLTNLVPSCRVTGQVRIENIDIFDPSCDLRELRRRVGMVFQKPNPFALSIRDNIALALSEERRSRSEIDAIVEASLRDAGLWKEVSDRLDTPATSLSGGQQQRLCIARAWALQPSILLCDEPCSALDPIASGAVEELVLSLRERVTVVIVTHNLAQARRIADQALVFWVRDGAGTVIEAGAAESVFGAPSDPIAAAYLSGSRG